MKDHHSSTQHIAQLTCLTALGLVATLSGCTYDFDQFDGTTPGDMAVTMTDMGGDSSPGPQDMDMTTVVITPDQNSDMFTADMAMMKSATGEDCTEDAACQSGLCVEGICLDGCIDDACAAGFTCKELDEDRSACLPICERDGDACEIGARTDLTCVRRITYAESALSPTQLRTFLACDVDQDGDNVADDEDNCPDEANALQRDRDQDGQGDACDDEPLCTPGHTSGKQSLEDIPWNASGLTAPSMLDSSWILLLGGELEEGTPSSQRVRIERQGLSAQALPDNLYAAYDFGLTALSGDQAFVMPGALEEGGRQVGRHLGMSKEGVIEQGATVTTPLYSPVLGTTRLGVMIMAAYIDPPDVVTGARLRTWRYEGGGFVASHNVTLEDRPRVYVTRAKDGGVRVYTGPDTDASNVGGQKVSQHIILSELGVHTDSDTIPLPAPDVSLGAVDPLYLTTPGGFEVIIDRKRGTGYQVVRNEPLINLVERTAYTIQLDALAGEFIALPEAMSMMFVGNSTVENDQSLKLTEYALACMDPVVDPVDTINDTDSDGIDDRQDVCVGIEDPEQLDADGDGQGDACDADADNDGIANALDVITQTDGMVKELWLDTDNDGIDNPEDTDDDSDGIPDAQDRFALDTDNDGLPNRYDTDDDNDGFPDATERSAGTDPHHPMDYPGVGFISFVTQPGSGERSVQWGKVTDLVNAETVAFGVAAHQPRFSSTGRSMVALDAASGSAQNVLWAQVENPEQDPFMPASETFELGVGALKAVSVSVQNDMVLGEQAEAFQVVHERAGEAMRWDISSVSAVQVDEMYVPEVYVEKYALVEDLYVAGGRIYFIGAPTQCDACESVYSTPMMPGAEVTSVLEDYYGDMKSLRVNSGQLAVVKDGALIYKGVDVELPRGVGEVNSAVALGGGNHLVVSAQSEDGTYDLWHFDDRTRRWSVLLDVQDDVIELDWRP